MRDRGAANTKAIFLLGVPRSGTTLLRLLLNSHSDIAIPFESFVLIDFASRIGKEYNDLTKANDRRRLLHDLLNSRGISKWDPKVTIDDICINECFSYSKAVDQIFSAYARKCGKTYWGDKTPSYVTDLHVLYELFPKAKFIHLIRDGRDVALSLVRQPWGPNTLLSALRRWTEIITWSRKMGRMLPQDQYMEVLFEDLVFDPNAVIQQIMRFLDLPFEESVIEQYNEGLNTKMPVASSRFHRNLGRPIDKSLALKWIKVLTRVDQTICYQISGNLFQQLGYPLGCTSTARVKLQLRKLFLAVLEVSTWRMKRYKRLFFSSSL